MSIRTNLFSLLRMMVNSLYAEKIRIKGIRRAWSSKIWHKQLPPKITTFLWKLMRHAIPVDSRVCAKAIQMASRCRCCKFAAVETISHLSYILKLQQLHENALEKSFACHIYFKVWLKPCTPRCLLSKISHTTSFVEPARQPSFFGRFWSPDVLRTLKERKCALDAFVRGLSIRCNCFLLLFDQKQGPLWYRTISLALLEFNPRMWARNQVVGFTRKDWSKVGLN